MSGGHKYIKSTNPFDIDDEENEIDDETFLRNSRRRVINQSTAQSHQPSYQHYPQSTNNFDEQILTFQERKRAIEDRTINSTEKSLSILRDSEQIGIATAEELMRQREKLEKTDKQLDEINSALRFSQKHINGIKSVFSSLKNYMSRKNDPNISSNGAMKTNNDLNKQSSPSNSNLQDDLNNYDRFDNHPTTRLRNTGDYSNGGITGIGGNSSSGSSGGSKDFSARLDANLQEMCSNISRLKGLAGDMSSEIDSQNDLIGTIIDKTDKADLTINRQNKDMMRILKK